MQLFLSLTQFLLFLKWYGPLGTWCTSLALPTCILIQWNLSVWAWQEGNRPSNMRNGLDVHVHARYTLAVRAHLIVMCRCCCFTAALLLLYYLHARYALSVRAHLIVICPALGFGLFSKQGKQLTSIVEQTSAQEQTFTGCKAHLRNYNTIGAEGRRRGSARLSCTQNKSYSGQRIATTQEVDKTFLFLTFWRREICAAKSSMSCTNQVSNVEVIFTSLSIP